MRLELFLLCSVFFQFTFASNRLRFFHFNGSEVNHNAALKACKANGSSLVTVYDEEDIEFIGKYERGVSIWLGLTRKEQSSTWSNGNPVSFSKSSVNVTNGEQICEAIDGEIWRGYNCSDKKPFMCYKGNDYFLIEEKKNWCQALQHCRQSYTDLVSISNITQYDEVTRNGNNMSFWIGLLHDEWEWEDGGCSTFRKWDSRITPDKHECTAYDSAFNDSLYRVPCSNEAHIFCSKGNVRIKVIEKNSTWEEALEYCSTNHTRLLCIENEQDQKAVEQWLNKTEADGPFWIGLRQSHVFGFWVWSDRIVHYSKWKNDTQPELPFSNSCGVIHKDDFEWSDEDCWTPRYFLCEEEITHTKKTNVDERTLN